MLQLQRFSSFLLRLLITSVMALCIQIGLFVKDPDLLLTVQEAVKRGTVQSFDAGGLASTYRVAFNLLNGDGILVHTAFVMVSFTVLYVAFLPLQLLFRHRRPADG